VRWSYPWLELGWWPGQACSRSPVGWVLWRAVVRRMWCASELGNGWVSSTRALGTCQCPLRRGGGG
jgi:hypothetical protein